LVLTFLSFSSLLLLCLLLSSVAHTHQLAYYSVSSHELRNQYYGETDKNLRTIMLGVATLAPVMLVFEECEVLCPANAGKDNLDDAVGKAILGWIDDSRPNMTGVFPIFTTNYYDKVNKATLSRCQLKTNVTTMPLTKEDYYDTLCSVMAQHIRVVVPIDCVAARAASDELLEHLLEVNHRDNRDLVTAVKDAVLDLQKALQRKQMEEAAERRAAAAAAAAAAEQKEKKRQDRKEEAEKERGRERDEESKVRGEGVSPSGAAARGRAEQTAAAAVVEAALPSFLPPSLLSLPHCSVSSQLTCCLRDVSGGE
jgi:SpoVK/Ycf46/Vps4 family AAA+-type ATPase